MMREREICLGDGWERAPGGIYLPPKPEPPKRERREYSGRPIGIDLFAGAGGFSLGVIHAGFEVVAAMDNDPTCFATYMGNLGAWPCEVHYADDEARERLGKYWEKHHAPKRNAAGVWTVDFTSGSFHRRACEEGRARPFMNDGQHGGPGQDEPFAGVSHYFFGDARKFTGEQILAAIGREFGDVDCVFGGPPCQGYSKGGRRDVMDPRNSLIFEFARLVCEMHPRAMILENVPGICSMTTPEGLPVVDALCSILEAGGMGAHAALKEMLANTSGAGVALKGAKSKKQRQAKADEEDDDEPEPTGFRQLALEMAAP